MEKATKIAPGALSGTEEVDAEVARLVSSGIRIPPQPRIVIEVLRMLASPRSDFRAIAEVVTQDAGLTAMMFKLTRSAALAHVPASVERILSVIGTQQAAALVQAYGLTAAMQGDARVLERFWARSTTIAQIASCVAAERISVCNVAPEQAYMAGIFHDCGVPVLMQRFPSYCQQTGLDTLAGRWADVRAEDAAFNVDHCSIGYLLARHWRLPDFVAESILHHHELDSLTEHNARSMVAILQLAIELFSRDHGLPNRDWANCESVVLDELAIHPDDLVEFLDGVIDAYRMLDGK